MDRPRNKHIEEEEFRSNERSQENERKYIEMDSPEEEITMWDGGYQVRSIEVKIEVRLGIVRGKIRVVDRICVGLRRR